MRSALPALLVWNAWLLAAWVGRFHIAPRDLVRAASANFPAGGFSLGTLLGNWATYGIAAVCLAGIAAIALRAGEIAVRFVEPRMPGGGERTLCRFAAGLGVIGGATLAAGLTGLLFAPPRTASLMALAAAAGLEVVRRRPRLVVPRDGLLPRLSLPTWLILGAAGAVTALGLLNIEMGWDAFTYHLRIPTFHLYRHKVFDVWHHYCGTFPSHIEMVYAFAMMVEGETLVRFLNFSFGAGLLAAAAATARRAGAFPGWPVALLIASPTFLNLTTRAYIDLGFALYCALCILSLLRWRQSGSRAAVVTAGLMAGWAMGSKYVGILIVPAALAALAPVLRTASGRAAALTWAAAAAPPLLPWLARNWLIRANPVAPFLGGLFGARSALPAEFTGTFGEGASLAGFVASLPARVEAIFFDFGAINGPLTPLVAGLLPAVALIRLDSAAGFLRRAVAGYAVCWFVLCPDARFFLPILPVLAVIFARVIERVAAEGRVASATARVFLEAGLVAGVLYSAGIQWVFYAPASIPLGFETPAEKLERVLPPAPFTSRMKDFVNAHLPAGARILYLCHFNTYHVERECIADFHFGEAHITRVIRKGATAEGMEREFRRMGVEWLLSTGTGAAQYAGVPGFFAVSDRGWREFKKLLCKYGEVSWQSDEYTLFHLGSRHAWRRLPAFPVYEALAFREGDAAMAEGRFADALEIFLSPPDELKEVGSTYVRQGDAYRGTGDVKRAIAAYERALDLGVQSARLNVGLAQALLGNRMPAEALLHANAAWGRNPRSAQAAATLAGAYATMGNFDAGLRWVDRAIELEPRREAYREMRERIVAASGYR